MRMTRDEILLIAIILAAVIIGAAAKQYRNTHPKPLPVSPPPVGTPYPKPNYLKRR